MLYCLLATQSLDNQIKIDGSTGGNSFLRKRNRDENEIDPTSSNNSSENEHGVDIHASTLTIDELATNRQLIQRNAGVDIEAVELEMATTTKKKKKKKKKKKNANRDTEAPTPELSSAAHYSIPQELIDCLLRALPRRPARKRDREKKNTNFAAIERRAEAEYDPFAHDDWIEDEEDDEYDGTEGYDREIYDFLYQDDEEADLEDETFMDDDDLMSYIRRLQTDPSEYDQDAVRTALEKKNFDMLWIKI